MRILQYPALERPASGDRCPRYMGCNTVTSVLWTDVCFPEREGTLSLKCVWQGEAIYESEQARFRVTPENYLVLNQGQCYSGFISPDVHAETLTLFFGQGCAEETLRGMVTPADHLLDAPFERSRQAVLFFPQTYAHDGSMQTLLAALRQALRHEGTSSEWYDERFYDLLARLLWTHRNIAKEIARMPALRASTRVEMYQRLSRARDYMEAYLTQPLPLEEIAEAAWFSPYHFLRVFKQVYQETPHQYLTRRRLERACRLLIETETPISTVCTEVGFESLSSFSTLFHRKVGMAPTVYRERNRRTVL